MTVKLSIFCIVVGCCATLAIAYEDVPAAPAPANPLASLLSEATLGKLAPGAIVNSFSESTSSTSANGAPITTTIQRSESSSSQTGGIPPVDLKQSFEKFQQSAKELYTQLQNKVNSSAIFSSSTGPTSLRSETALSQTSSSSGNPLANIANPFAGLNAQNPFANLQNPLAGFQNPLAGLQNPLAGIQNPLAGAQNPLANFRNPFENLGSQLGLPGAGPSPQAVTGGITGQNFGDKISAALAPSSG